MKSFVVIKNLYIFKNILCLASYPSGVPDVRSGNRITISTHASPITTTFGAFIFYDTPLAAITN